MKAVSNKKELVVLMSTLLSYSFLSYAASLDYSNTTVWGNLSSSNNYDQVNIINTVDASYAPLSGYGLYNATGVMDFPVVNITTGTQGGTTGYHSDGIRQAYTNTSLTLGDNLNITTWGVSADGINMSITNSSVLNIGNNAIITTADGMGVRANLSKVTNATNNNTVNIGDNLEVTTQGKGDNSGVTGATDGSNNMGGNDKATGYAVYAGNRDYETEAQPTGGLSAAYINIGNASKLTTYGENAHAVYANKTGVISLGSTTITTNNKSAHGLYAKDGSVTNVDSNFDPIASSKIDYAGGVINLLGDTKITVDTSSDGTANQSYAIYSSGNGSVIASSNAAGTLNTNIYTITGDVKADNAGKVDLTMSNGSVFTGNTSIDNTSELNLKIAGANSRWDMSQSSNLSSLDLSGASVSLGNQSSTLNNTNNVTLTMEQLKGSGTFNMRADIVGQMGDLIVVTDTAAGAHKLNITNNGAVSTNGTETLTVVKAGTNNASFSLANKVEQGAYEYGLRNVASSPNDVELYALPSGSGGGVITTTAEAASSFLNIGYLTSYIDNQTLLQRLGDLRNSEAAGVKSNGLWIREFGGKLSAFSGSGLSGFDMTYTGTQIGIDKQIDVTSGNLLIGAMAGYTRTNPNYSRGNGDGKNYTAGLYATYFLDNGLYVDSVLKYNSMRNHFNVEDTAGNTVKGTGKTQGIMASVEVGKRLWLDNHQQGLYIEPQMQLSYGYQSGDSVHSSNGLKVGLSHYNSTLGRASAIVGYQIKGENPINVYLKTGVVREMSGGASYRFNDGVKNNHTFRSSWFDNGIGANININKKHNIYAEADYSTGNHFDNAMLNVGYRYSF